VQPAQRRLIPAEALGHLAEIVDELMEEIHGEQDDVP
jgi:hypothetical protein